MDAAIPAPELKSNLVLAFVHQILRCQQNAQHPSKSGAILIQTKTKQNAELTTKPSLNGNTRTNSLRRDLDLGPGDANQSLWPSALSSSLSQHITSLGDEWYICGCKLLGYLSCCCVVERKGRGRSRGRGGVDQGC